MLREHRPINNLDVGDGRGISLIRALRFHSKGFFLSELQLWKLLQTGEWGLTILIFIGNNKGTLGIILHINFSRIN